MKKTTGLLICILLLHYSATAQSFAINTTGATAHPSAMLDVTSINKGLLIPRMTKTERNSIVTPATGLMIFQTGPDSIGFHYYSGSAWNWVSSSSNGGDWKLTGNTGTDTATNFIGTNDNMALRFKINSQQAGLLSSNNNLIGLGAGNSLGTSTGITAIGVSALGLNRNKNDLVAVGDSALYRNTSTGATAGQSIKNSAFGSKALLNNTTGYNNTGIGFQSLYFNTNGIDNTAIGQSALASSTSGSQNTATGSNALIKNTTGDFNTATGYSALLNNTTGDFNTAIGSKALLNIITGSSNTAIGYETNRVNLIGSYNTAIGYHTLYSATRDYNTAIGAYALFGNTSGLHNTAVGAFAKYNTSGNYCTALGDSANTLGNINATAIGAKSFADCSDCLVLGSINGANGATSNVNVGIGITTPQASLHVKRGAILFDSTIGSTPVSGPGTRMMWIPAKAAFRGGRVTGAQWDDVNIGFASTAMGYNTYGSGFYSTAMGSGSDAFGDYSTAMGGGTSAHGIYSTAMGSFSEALGGYSTAMGGGTFALGNYSTAMGLNTNASGSYSTAMGWGSISSGSGSIAVGSYTIASGLNSAALGYFTTASGDASTALGHFVTSKSFGGFVTGHYNDSINAASPGNINSLNRIFQIGNGTANNARSNAMTVLQNGNIGIGELNPTSPLNFASTVGDKIALWGNGANHYGFGIQASLMQLHTEASSSDIAFGYGNSAAFTENVRIKGNGNVGIGTVNPVVPLNFSTSLGDKIALWSNGTTHYGLGLQPFLMQLYTEASTSDIAFGYGNSAAFTETMRIKGTGNVGIGTPLPTAKLSVNGTANNTTGGWAIFSDERIKTISGDFTDGLNVIRQIQPVNFVYNDKAPFRSDDAQIGIVAQDLEKIAPYMVSQQSYQQFTDLREVNSQAYTFLLINAVKEQQVQIESQQKENTEQKNRIDKLEKMVYELVGKFK